MQRSAPWALVMFTPLFALACGATGGVGAPSARAVDASMGGAAVPATESPEAPVSAEAGASPSAASDGSGLGVGPAASDTAASPAPDGPDPATAPMLIYTAQLSLAVEDVDEALDGIEQIARDCGGYLLSRSNSQVTVRVPVARFGGSLDAAAGQGDVLRRSVQARDVTAEVRDLRIRLESAQAMRKRLEELLARAVDVKSALEVERELERIIEQIERMRGQLKQLGELAAYSTLTVVATEQPKEQVADDGVRMPFAWLRDLGLVRLLDLGDS